VRDVGSLVNVEVRGSLSQPTQSPPVGFRIRGTPL